MNTETGSILKDLRKNKRTLEKKIREACIYARDNNLSLKDVGVYELQNGHLIKDRYPTKKASELFESISAVE